jgi:hypothetical protein
MVMDLCKSAHVAVVLLQNHCSKKKPCDGKLRVNNVLSFGNSIQIDAIV